MNCQLSHSCEIVLHGDRTTHGVSAAGEKFGSKGIVVFGELNLVGQTRSSSWSKLKSHVESGASSFVVQNVGDFKKGDKIVVSPTDFDPNHAEIVTITKVVGHTLYVNIPFAHRHRCDIEKTEDTGIVCGEVGLLSRNVRIRGGGADVADSFHSLYEHEYGATVTVARRASIVSGSAVYERGRVNAQHVGFVNCGQAGFDDRHCLYFSSGLGSDGALSQINHVSFDYMFSSAVYVGKNVAGVRVADCVGYKSLGSMFVVAAGAGGSNAIVRTLSVLVVTVQTHRGAELRSFLGNVFWRHYPANFDVQAKGTTVTDNIAAGSERVGFKGWGAPCQTTPGGRMLLSWQWDRNEAHSTSIGTASLGDCPVAAMCYTNFKGWYNWDFGMWGSVTCSVHVQNAQMSDNGVAIHYGIGGPDSLSFLYGDKRFSLSDSTIVGLSDPSHCDQHRDTVQPTKHDKWSFKSKERRTGTCLPSSCDVLSILAAHFKTQMCFYPFIRPFLVYFSFLICESKLQLPHRFDVGHIYKGTQYVDSF